MPASSSIAVSRCWRARGARARRARTPGSPDSRAGRDRRPARAACTRPSAAPRTASRTSWPRLPRPRLRLRLRVRPGQHLRRGRHLRDGATASARATSGPTPPTRSGGNGSTNNNLNSRLLLPADQRQRASSRSCSTQPPPRGPAARDQARRVRGYVAGYNRYLRDTGVDNIPDPRCRGKRRGCGRSPRWTPTGASTSSACSPARASRSTASAARSRRAGAERAAAGAAQTQHDRRARRRSCRSAASAPTPYGARHATRPTTAAAWCSATRTSRGTGSERFYQAQLTIPGKIDVSGAQPVRRAARPDRPHRRTSPGATPSRPPTASRRSS